MHSLTARGCPHASKRSSGTWRPDDYDVIHFQTAGGRATRSPLDVIDQWAVVMPHLPSHGFCATPDEAKAKFAETWRAWWR